ncbi:cohesin domain-containing protein, partial [bacterium]|nr:cohesin domain-containing protein [bacterium]
EQALGGFTTEGNIFVGYYDAFSSVSDNPATSFGLVDNLRVIGNQGTIDLAGGAKGFIDDDHPVAAGGVYLEITARTPIIDWAKPEAITYGTAISAAQLNPSTEVAGSFAFETVAGTILGAGQYTLKATFTPDDADSWIPVALEVPLVVNRAKLTIKAQSVERVFGEDNPNFVLSLDGFVNGEGPSDLTGTVVATTEGTKDSTPGSYAITTSGVSSDNYDIEFLSGDAGGVLTITKGHALLSWAKPATVIYGKRLSGAELNALAKTDAGVQIEGTFVYAPVAGTLLGAGSHTLKVTFVPASQAGYSGSQTEVVLTVQKAPLLIAADDAQKYHKTDNPALGVTYTGFIAGEGAGVLSQKPTLTASADKSSIAGNYTITAAGAAAANYNISYKAGVLKVSGAPPVIDWGSPASIVYGTKLSATQLSAKANVGGDLTYDPVLGTLLGVGAHTLTVRFIPADPLNYRSASTSRNVTVKKAPLQITVKDAVRAVNRSNPDFKIVYDGFVNDEGADVLSTRPSASVTATTASPEGEYPITVSGAAADNYAITYVDGTLSVMEQFAVTLSVTGGVGSITKTPDKELYDFDDSVSLEVIPARWHEFVQWDDGSTVNPRTVTPANKSSLVATVKPTTELETLTLGDESRLAPVGMPAVFVDGNYASGEAEVVSPDFATVNITSSFEDGIIFYQVNDSAQQLFLGSFEVDKSATIKAVAYSADSTKSVESDPVKIKVLPKLKLTATTTGGGSVSVVPDQAAFLQGTEVTLQAKADEGWVFLGWEGDVGEGAASEYSFAVDREREIRAVFGTKVKVNTVGSGKIELSPQKEFYVHGEKVVIQARPNEGFYFVTFSGAKTSTTSPDILEVTMPNGTLGGFFLALPAGKVSLTTIADGMGRIEFVDSAPVNVLNEGDSVKLKAVAEPGYFFTGWSGDAAGDDNPITLTIDSSKTVTAGFSSGFTVTLKSQDGSITVEPMLDTYPPGTEVTLTAVSDEGKAFAGWSGDLEGKTNPVTLTMDQSLNAEALFGSAYKVVSAVKAGKGTIQIGPEGNSFLEGTTILVNALPGAGFEFKEWDVNGEKVPTNPIPPFAIEKNLTVDAYFKDVQKPKVTILEPIGGVTGNENINLRGLLSDNGTLESVNWLRGEENQGVLELAEDKFDLKGIVLLKGDNSYTVVAKDTEGNESAETVNVTWEPLRTLELVDAPERQEGKRINIPVKLDSNGDVGGMTFILNYDHQVLKDPILVWSSAAGTSINSVNTDVPGEVKATFSLVGSGLPEGDQLIATVSFRVRSVPGSMYTDYNLEVLDMSMTDGNQVNYGTHVDPGTARLLKRKYNGDSNGNDRLDIGDGTLVQRLLTGFDEKRSWDSGGNDLNGNGKLDSGDVILLLRTVVGLDKQPSDGNRDIAKMNPRPVIRMGGPDDEPVEMASIRLVEKTAGKVKVQVVSENLESEMSGIAFTLHYPVEKLRLKDQKAHSVGEIVPDDAVTIWNVFPSQNDYLKQTGKVRLALSNVEQWELANGVLAEFELEMKGGEDLNEAELSLSEVELTPTGYDNRMLPDVVLGLGEKPQGDGPVITDVSPEPLSFSFKTDAGAKYQVEATDDLRKWNLVEKIQGTGAVVEFTDKREALFERQYYRVRVE